MDLIREGKDSKGGDPFLLEHLPELVVAVLMQLLKDEHFLCVHFPRDVEAVYPTAEYHDPNDLIVFLQRVGKHLVGPAAQELYPISVWRLPEVGRQPAIRAVEAFRAAPGDESALMALLDADVWRVALFPASLTLSVPCAHLESAEAMMRLLVANCPVEVDWA